MRLIASLFQSTHPREGVRPMVTSGNPLEGRISIHAPPRRSATKSKAFYCRDVRFQSTHPREGVRLPMILVNVASWAFQSTHPREGVRLWRYFYRSLQCSLFQSTHPREGVRLSSRFSSGGFGLISIHAPPRRSATASISSILASRFISIHAPPRRSATIADL